METVAPTSEELTRALMLAFKGDSNMTSEEKDYVRDVTRRDINARAERELALLELLLEGEREQH